MNKEKKEFQLNLRTGSLMTYIGISLIFLSGINLIIEIPSVYMIGISFAAFFFVFADFIGIKDTLNKFYLSFYSFLLFLGISSFIILPIILMVLNVKIENLITISETMSIASLGLVLGIINIKNKENDLSRLEKNLAIMDKYEVLVDSYEKKITRYEELTKEMSKEIENLKK